MVTGRSGTPLAPSTPPVGAPAAAPRALASAQRRALALFEPTTSTIVPTWTLGGVILVTSLVILIASLTS
jgi:hypothetical protein